MNPPESPFSLHGQTALLTGSTGFFGRGFADAMASAGASVCLFGRSEQVFLQAERLAANHRDVAVRPYQVDNGDDAAFRRTLALADQETGGIDILINNAFEFSPATGFNDPSGKLETISHDQWLRALDAGVAWPATAVQILGEGMKKRGRGSIINISSMYALVSPDPALYEGTQLHNPPTYGAAKAALLAFTRYVAAFYGAAGVRCNALLPGAFPNPDPIAFNSPRDEEFTRRLAQRTVLGRVGRIEDLTGALVFLAAPASAYMTGQALVVDGGWTIL
ncbi:MAG: SDR family oxidoreductase [Gemmatimonadetes bacterium]|nr:SDR family oxidoreductase [Gemmatimonadota bacterium]